jgi:hypothetical protein
MSATCRQPGAPAVNRCRTRSPRPHPRGGTRLGLPVSARCEKTAVQRDLQHLTDRPKPELGAMNIDAFGHQCCIESSRAAKKPTPNPISHCPSAAPRSPGTAASSPRTRRARSMRHIGPALSSSQGFRGDPEILRHALQRLRPRRVIGTRVSQQPDYATFEPPIVSPSYNPHHLLIRGKIRNKTQPRSIRHVEN